MVNNERIEWNYQYTDLFSHIRYFYLSKNNQRQYEGYLIKIKSCFVVSKSDNVFAYSEIKVTNFCYIDILQLDKTVIKKMNK